MTSMWLVYPPSVGLSDTRAIRTRCSFEATFSMARTKAVQPHGSSDFDGERAMHCPICSLVMSAAHYEGVVVHACDECGGEYVAASDLVAIVNTRQAAFSDALVAELRDARPAMGVPIECDRALRCPECSDPMVVMNYCGDTGICVDRCESCDGIWLDHQELERIQILLDQWSDAAPDALRSLSHELEQSRRAVVEQHSRAFIGSRFAFVNALLNRFLDAA